MTNTPGHEKENDALGLGRKVRLFGRKRFIFHSHHFREQPRKNEPSPCERANHITSIGIHLKFLFNPQIEIRYYLTYF